MNPFKEHILSYVSQWKCVREEQVASQRFVEDGYYDQKVCGSFQKNLDELIIEGTIRRVKFEVDNTEVSLLMPQNAKFKGWC